MLLLDRGVAKKALSISKSTLFKLKLSEDDIIQWNKVIKYCKAISVVPSVSCLKICLSKLIFKQLLNCECVYVYYVQVVSCFYLIMCMFEMSRITSCVSN